MAFEEGDITLLRRDATQELGQDDLVEEPDSAGPPAVPPAGRPTRHAPRVPQSRPGAACARLARGVRARAARPTGRPTRGALVLRDGAHLRGPTQGHTPRASVLPSDARALARLCPGDSRRAPAPSRSAHVYRGARAVRCRGSCDAAASRQGDPVLVEGPTARRRSRQS